MIKVCLYASKCSNANVSSKYKKVCHVIEKIYSWKMLPCLVLNYRILFIFLRLLFHYLEFCLFHYLNDLPQFFPRWILPRGLITIWGWRIWNVKPCTERSQKWPKSTIIIFKYFYFNKFSFIFNFTYLIYKKTITSS